MKPCWYALIILLFLAGHHSSWASNLNPLPSAGDVQTTEITPIAIVINPIFDESAPNSFFIHRWANFLHINTRKSVIINKLSFDKNEIPTQKDLEESERILRAETYIRDSKIYFTDQELAGDSNNKGQRVVIETWDKWSLLPSFNLGRSGGETKFSAGIQEDNLLGSGTKIQARYKSEPDRTGSWFALDMPLSIIQYAKISVDYHDNSDGQLTHGGFNKPFHTLDTKNLYSAEALEDTHIDTLRQNGVSFDEFEHHLVNINLKYGWLLNRSKNKLSRLVAGFTVNKHQFAAVDGDSDTALPQDRNFHYPWVSYEYQQDNHHVLNNIHSIALNEDFNLGWKHYLKLGIETRDTREDSPVGYHLEWKTSKGLHVEQQLLFLFFHGEGIVATRQKDFLNSMPRLSISIKSTLNGQPIPKRGSAPPDQLPGQDFCSGRRYRGERVPQ